MVQTRETANDGEALAVEMARALSGCGDRRGALAHLEAAGRRRPLTLDAERHRASLEACMRAEGILNVGAPSRPPVGFD